MYKFLTTSKLFFLLLVVAITGCNDAKEKKKETIIADTTVSGTNADTSLTLKREIVEETSPESLLTFARTLQGIPYLYASTDPAKGFDCSGFITYVFNHFGIEVPRSSVDFTNYGKPIDTADARPGDLILFTGTDSATKVVGHMGIIESRNEGKLWFIHSSSGKNNIGVVITPFENYYRSRFVKVIRVFDDRLFD